MDFQCFCVILSKILNEIRIRPLKIDVSFRRQTKIKKKGGRGEVENWELRGRVERFCWEVIYSLHLVYWALICFATALSVRCNASKLCLCCVYRRNDVDTRLKHLKSFGERALNTWDLSYTTESSSESFVYVSQRWKNS